MPIGFCSIKNGRIFVDKIPAAQVIDIPVLIIICSVFFQLRLILKNIMLYEGVRNIHT